MLASCACASSHRLRPIPSARTDRPEPRPASAPRGAGRRRLAPVRSPARLCSSVGIVAQIVEVVAAKVRSPRTAAGRPARTAGGSPGRRAGHAVEHARGRRAAAAAARDSRVHRHRRPAVRPHRQRRVVADRRARVLALRRRRRAPRGPRRRRAPTRGPTSSRPSSSGTSDRPCVRCADVDAEHVAERRVQVDVRRQRVDRAAGASAGPRDQQRDVAERLVDAARRACPRCPSRRGSGRGRCTRSTAVSSHSVAARRARRAAGRTSGRSSTACRRSCARIWRASRSVEHAASRTAPTAYGGQIEVRRRPSRRRTSTRTAPACRTARAGRTRRRTARTRSCAAGVLVEPVGRGRASCAGPGKSSSSRNQRARDRRTGVRARGPSSDGAPTHDGSGRVRHGSPSWPRS